MAGYAFDAQYYLTNNPDVAAAVSRGLFANAEDHYNQFGRFEGRDPNAVFDTSYYLAEYPDVANSGINPLQHFLTFGAVEARVTNANIEGVLDLNGNGSLGDDFNSAKYLQDYPDVATAVANGQTTAIAHFLQFGQFEGRTATLTNGATITGPLATGGSTAFTLTAGVDTLTGTSGADVFNALTVNAAGAAASTLTAFDNINGGAGNDTLNIFSDGTNNKFLGANSSITNIETINISNTTSAFVTTDGGSSIDASKFVGATTINQSGLAASVTNLASTTTAGFRDIATGATVTAAATAAAANLALSNVAEGQTFTVSGAALNSVTVSGAVADTNANGTVANTTLAATAGTDVQTFNVNTAVATTLTVSKASASTKEVTTVDASASTGAITYNAANTVATIKTGAAADTVTVATVTAVAAGSTAAVGASVSTGAGNDAITVNTSGTGTTTIDAGVGDDTVTVTQHGSGVFSVNLGDGSDKIAFGAVALTATDVIVGGAGTDTISLNGLDLTSNTNAAQLTALNTGVTGFEVLEFTGSAATKIAGGTGTGAFTNTEITKILFNTTGTGALDTIDNAGSARTYAFGELNAGAATLNGTAGVTTFNVSLEGITGNGGNVSTLTTNFTNTGSTQVGTGTINLNSIGTNDASFVNSIEKIVGQSNAGALTTTSVVVTGSHDLTIGTTGTGIGFDSAANVNASAFTGKLNIWGSTAQDTIVGGAGADTIHATAGADTYAGGAGADTFVFSAVNQGSSNNLTTIADFVSGTDKLTLTDLTAGTGTFNATAVNVSAAPDFASALNLAAAGNGGTNGIVSYFQQGGNTYVVVDNDAGATFNATTDAVIKLTGVVNLVTADVTA